MQARNSSTTARALRWALPTVPPCRAARGPLVIALLFGAALSTGACSEDRAAPTPPTTARQSGGSTANRNNRADLIVVGGTLVTMNRARRVIEDGGLAAIDGEIVAIGTADEIRAAYSAAEVVEARAHDIVMPGLINGHGHAPMVLMRGIADDLALMDWLQNYIFPAEAKTVDEEFVRVGMRLAALEMIASGTTTFVDGYYFEDAIAEEADIAGLRGVLGETIIGFPVPDHPDTTSSLEYTRTFIERWLDHPRITATAFPHSPYTVDPDVLRATAALTREYGVPLLIHLAETRDEVEQIEQRYGVTPAEHLENLGFLGPDLLGAHGIWLTDRDIEILRRHDVGLVHNPESNLKLASGRMRLPDLLEAGVAVGLGTDGAASNNDLDMFNALTLASFLHKHDDSDPTAIPAQVVVAMATIGGARALRMDNEIGSLELGKRADLIVIDGEAANMVPRYDPYSHTAYAARGGNVRGTIVDGKVLYLDGEHRTLDAASIVADARRVAARIRTAIASAAGDRS